MRGSILVIGLLLFISAMGIAVWFVARDTTQNDPLLDVLDNRPADGGLSGVRDPAFCEEVEANARPELIDSPTTNLPKEVTRSGISLRLPENLELSPEGPPYAVQWFFSSGFDRGIDRDAGIRLTVGLFQDRSTYPDTLSFLRDPSGENRPGPADPFTSFTLGGSVGGCSVFLPGPDVPAGAVKLETRATTDDLLGPREFNQRALIELADGRFVEVALDGLPDVIPWVEQVRIFNSVAESVRSSTATTTQGSPE